ncbi:hypothetical protein [Amycolatopsis sp. NPDC051071]
MGIGRPVTLRLIVGTKDKFLADANMDNPTLALSSTAAESSHITARA